MSEPVVATADAPKTTTDERLGDVAEHVAADTTFQKQAEQLPPFDVKALTDRALQFLATASNETLGACLIGLGAGTYLILGRVGLVLIGVVGGVVLHATWEGQSQHGEGTGLKGKNSEALKRELGAQVANRILDWRGQKDTQDGDKEDSDLSLKLYSGRNLDYSEFKPETAAALTELTDAVVRDYVKWWYSPILPAEDAFPNSCRQTLTAFMLSVSAHLSRKRPADNFVDFVTRSSSFMIILLQELSAAIMSSPGDAPSEAVDIYLKKQRDSTLASILDTEYQTQQFSVAAEDILQNYLEHKTYNCMPARLFLHQILAKVILEMIVVSCSKPEFINGWIVYLLEDGEPELMNAIDAGVEGSSGQLQNVKDNIEKTTGKIMSPERREHQRNVSRAQDAMDEAMHEAQRLSRMIAEEDAKRLKSMGESTSSLTDDQSASTTQGIVTPTSSQSEATAEGEAAGLGISALPSQSSHQLAQASPPPASPPTAAEESKKAFTSFDQLLGNNPPTALLDDDERPVHTRVPPLTLYNSTMSIFDDSMPGEKAVIRNKPNVEYLVQIEPSSHHHPGWMTARTYAEFETLHEVIRRIAAITGATGFIEAHAQLPGWKGHTKPSLRGELERYLNDAVKYKSLAESEGMKRFLEKELGTGKTPGSGFPGIGWAGQTFDTMGRGLGSTFDALSKAPKEVAGGGKALFGGVTGVLGSVAPFGAKKNRDSVTSTTVTNAASASGSTASLSRTSTNTSEPLKTRHSRAESIVPELPTHIRSESTLSMASKRASMESLRNSNSPIIDQQPQREAQMERRPSYNPDGDGKRSGRSSRYGSRAGSRAPSPKRSMDLTSALGGDQIMNLPPMPSEIEDDYNVALSRASLDPFHARNASRTSLTASTNNDPVPPVPSLPRRPSAISVTTSATTSPSKPVRKPRTYNPISEPETTVLIELFFAVINELYTLSSAWTLRRTLLNAAKTFLLRPGNPQLASITALFQTTLDSSTSDEGMARQLRKMRENALPTEEELKKWPQEASEEEKEKLRVKARRLLVERGMPSALTSVMGQAASGEALGKVFDCLQEPRVARGVMFGLVLQGLRAVTQ
ncbi:PXA domain-containing protein [Boeremia exigua]|uniref:PXA domain-containing protein n=1 Tax=Boeremia exigua TaxID=749465 RepID=UPI001E8E6ED1|nr:PXA domain-containing protein [Boeremia exigua]KAH6644397.1 PXA domain-containing protein [Boeremia exigua]